nr:hypothetical protein CFP56_52817 [Quercus suber]
MLVTACPATLTMADSQDDNVMATASTIVAVTTNAQQIKTLCPFTPTCCTTTHRDRAKVLLHLPRKHEISAMATRDPESMKATFDIEMEADQQHSGSEETQGYPHLDYDRMPRWQRNTLRAIIASAFIQPCMIWILCWCWVVWYDRPLGTISSDNLHRALDHANSHGHAISGSFSSTTTAIVVFTAHMTTLLTSMILLRTLLRNSFKVLWLWRAVQWLIAGLNALFTFWIIYYQKGSWVVGFCRSGANIPYQAA